MTQELHIPTLQSRLDVVAAWLYDHAPYADVDQKHLDAGSPEQAYWHLGYMAALCDAIQLLDEHREPHDSRDMSSPYSPSGPDA
jgi:uncharacterized membrane protein YccC